MLPADLCAASLDALAPGTPLLLYPYALSFPAQGRAPWPPGAADAAPPLSAGGEAGDADWDEEGEGEEVELVAVAQDGSGGVFVRFLGRLTGLCPPSGFQTCFSGVTVDASDRFALGQTVVARVTAVDATAVPPRVSLTLAGAGGSKREQKTKNAASYEVDADPDAFLVRAVFADAEALDVLAEKRAVES